MNYKKKKKALQKKKMKMSYVKQVAFEQRDIVSQQTNDELINV